MTIDNEFLRTVNERHGRGDNFTADEIEGMSPAHYRTMLHGAAGVQRALPENVMLQNQRAAKSGLYSYTMEHVGDLTHRINEYGGELAMDTAWSKVKSMRNTLEHGYGFEREMHEQFAENVASKSGASFEDMKDLGQRYAESHSMVPVYNKPSLIARSAAVHLGLNQYDNVRTHLRTLHGMMSDQSTWNNEMSQEGAVRFLREEGR